jgi:hypothetical protein
MNHGLKRVNAGIRACVGWRRWVLLGAFFASAVYAQNFEGLSYQSQLDTAANAARLGLSFEVTAPTGLGLWTENTFALSEREKVRLATRYLIGAHWKLEIIPHFSLKILAAAARTSSAFAWPLGMMGQVRWENWDFKATSRYWFASNNRAQDFRFAIETQFFKSEKRIQYVGVEREFFISEGDPEISTWFLYFGVRF